MSSDESQPSTSHKRKSGDSAKTPTAILQELCVQECETLMFEDIKHPHETNPKMFACKAMAFEMCALGSGRSKKEAKHESCANLIAELVKLERFAGKLSPVPLTPHAPHPTTDGDAVGILLDICVQRELPLPTFDIHQSYGEPHRPVFTVICKLSSIKRTGTYSTKKGAKQIAARAVLEVVQNFIQNEKQQQLATVNPLSEPPEKLFKTYRQLKNEGIKPKTARLRDRHLFFLRLPEKERIEANKILLDTRGIYGTSKDKVDQACDALKLKYNIYNVPNDVRNRKIFTLESNHDCVLTGKEPDLYDEIIEHFKTMLNLNIHIY